MQNVYNGFIQTSERPDGRTSGCPDVRTFRRFTKTTSCEIYLEVPLVEQFLEAAPVAAHLLLGLPWRTCELESEMRSAGIEVVIDARKS